MGALGPLPLRGDGASSMGRASGIRPGRRSHGGRRCVGLSSSNLISESMPAQHGAADG